MITHISNSQINTFQACNKQWYVQKILNESTISTSQAARGNAFDQAVALKLGLVKLEDCPEVVALSKQGVEAAIATRIDEAVDLYLANGGWTHADEAQKEVRMTTNQWDTMRQLYDVDWTLPWPIVGYVDLFRKDTANPFETELCDLKTSERAEFRPQWSAQCALYCLITGASLFEIHLITFTKQIKLLKYAYRPSDATFAWVMNTIGAVADQMKRAASETIVDKIPATAGYQCRWCPRQNSCEASLAGSLVERSLL